MIEGFTFDDLLILPRYSDIKSSKECNTVVELRDTAYILPIISANMDTITEKAMVEILDSKGIASGLHRFCKPEETYIGNLSFASIGVKEGEYERFKYLLSSGANKFIIDVAHGAQQQTVDLIKKIRKDYYSPTIIVGNFATGESILEFERALGGDYVDGYKIGIGGGSMCTTRIATGCGAPTAWSIADCRRVSDKFLIADGGIRSPGDIAKALTLGADMCMIGSMLAGTYETPGEIVTDCGGPYKRYRGSASFGEIKEGVEALVPYKGRVADVIKSIKDGLRRSLAYVGARDIAEFKKKAQLIRVTGASYRESLPHGLKE